MTCKAFELIRIAPRAGTSDFLQPVTAACSCPPTQVRDEFYNLSAVSEPTAGTVLNGLWRGTKAIRRSARRCDGCH